MIFRKVESYLMIYDKACVAELLIDLSPNREEAQIKKVYNSPVKREGIL